MKLGKIIFSVLIIAIIVLLWVLILRPAYYSTALACSELDLSSQGITVVGTTQVNEDGEIEINLYTNDTKTLVYELCHKRQIEKGRLFSCEIPPLRFLNEAECYLSEYIYTVQSFEK